MSRAQDVLMNTGLACLMSTLLLGLLYLSVPQVHHILNNGLVGVIFLLVMVMISWGIKEKGIKCLLRVTGNLVFVLSLQGVCCWLFYLIAPSAFIRLAEVNSLGLATDLFAFPLVLAAPVYVGLKAMWQEVCNAAD